MSSNERATETAPESVWDEVARLNEVCQLTDGQVWELVREIKRLNETVASLRALIANAPTDWRQRAVDAEEVLRELLHAIDNGDALPHPTERKWDRVSVYVRSVAVSAARGIVTNGR